MLLSRGERPRRTTKRRRVSNGLTREWSPHSHRSQATHANKLQPATMGRGERFAVVERHTRPVKLTFAKSHTTDIRAIRARESPIPAGRVASLNDRKSHVSKGSCVPKPRDWRDVALGSVEPGTRRAKKAGPLPGFFEARGKGGPARGKGGPVTPVWMSHGLDAPTTTTIVSMLSVMNLPLDSGTTSRCDYTMPAKDAYTPPFADLECREQQVSLPAVHDLSLLRRLRSAPCFRHRSGGDPYARQARVQQGKALSARMPRCRQRRSIHTAPNTVRYRGKEIPWVSMLAKRFE